MSSNLSERLPYSWHKIRTFEYESDINFDEFNRLYDRVEKKNITFDIFLSLIEKYPIVKRLIWDANQPMFVYNEESVMTFNQYLFYCGGLIGLWFGTSAKDIVVFLAESQFWIMISTKIHLFMNRGDIVVNFRWIKLIIIKYIFNDPALGNRLLIACK